jgi:hypothetical protein
MKNLQPGEKWLIGAALAAALVCCNTAVSAQPKAAGETSEATAEDGEKPPSAKLTVKKLRPKRPIFPDTITVPAPPSGPIPIPYPNTAE